MDAGKLAPATVVEVPVTYVAVKVAQLPKPNGTIQRAFVNDANTAHSGTAIASAVVGGGANLVPVYSDGTTWRIG